jgi:uncharacterized protein YqjF (DUF2071 family)
MTGLTAAARQARTLEEVAHRPWPLPQEAWKLGQSWIDLCFLHWKVPAAQLRSLVPDALELDTFDGSAWIGITPFELEGLRLRGLPPLPGLSRFLELNVRTYVTAGGKPGIWFFSLDASSRLAVEGARRSHKLPYYRAEMSMRRRAGERYEVRSRRGGFRFQASYEPTGPPVEPEPGTLEHFLTERYCLYAENEGEVCRAQIHHPPWPLQTARAGIHENTMWPPGITAPGGEPLAHYSARQDVLTWGLEPVG